MTTNQQQPTDLDSDPIIVPTDGASVRQRHPLYYIELVLFEVDKTLYRVQKSGFLQANPKFFDRFNVPSDNNVDTSDANPIELNGVTSEVFEGLLSVFYPINGNTPTYEGWLGALELATQWDMPEIRAKTIDTLTTLHQSGSSTNIAIINLAKKYGIQAWLREGYTKLVQADLPKLEELIGLLDNETMMRILLTRSRLVAALTAASSGTVACTNCMSGYGYGSCLNGCPVKGVRTCDNCRQQKHQVFCDLYCPRQGRPTVGIHEKEKVETEIDRVFIAEFASMAGTPAA
ncbi:hypothetical protein CPB83DRAFT_900648 [Crepidotus variabilis]|uniref:BTB domain-containing protein n=1 Tax=Crepidotus variabilis TaxID=179855 RepID=A0A9P6BBR7_9AGAR|nr:hypothetical protein CPB83DRAFT_900648 [Crepidotus variabilis]